MRMATQSSHLHTLVLLYLTATVTGQFESVVKEPGWWMEQPYGNDTFNVIIEYNENVTLDCSDFFLEDDFTFSYWFRPDLKIMRAGESESFWSLDGTAGWEVNASTYEMHIYTAQENQFGFYHCVLTRDTEVYVVKKAINYQTPYYGDPWETYKKSTVIGCVAAGIFLVLGVTLFLISKCMYKAVDDNYSLGGSSVADLDLRDPREETSSSLSDSNGAVGPVKVPIPQDGHAVFINVALEVNEGGLKDHVKDQTREEATAF